MLPVAQTLNEIQCTACGLNNETDRCERSGIWCILFGRVIAFQVSAKSEWVRRRCLVTHCASYEMRISARKWRENPECNLCHQTDMDDTT
jgi:hypothetical protein